MRSTQRGTSGTSGEVIKVARREHEGGVGEENFAGSSARWQRFFQWLIHASCPSANGSGSTGGAQGLSRLPQGEVARRLLSRARGRRVLELWCGPRCLPHSKRRFASAVPRGRRSARCLRVSAPHGPILTGRGPRPGRSWQDVPASEALESQATCLVFSLPDR